MALGDQRVGVGEGAEGGLDGAVVGGALAQRGFTPVLCTRTAGGLSEADYVGMLLDQHVSGVVFAGGHFAEQAAPHDHYRLLRSRGIPVVLFNAAVDNLDFPCVSTDDVTAAGQAYTHLASLGHQRIGLVVGPQDHMPSRRKLDAFTELATRDGTASPSGRALPVEHALFSLEGGQAATTRLLRHGVTGVICASDVLALGAVRAVRRAGLSVPGDVSVVGFDDSAFMNCTDPPLTTVRQPIESMGKAAVALLVNQIENVAVYPEELLFEPELVVRGSTGRRLTLGERTARSGRGETSPVPLRGHGWVRGQKRSAIGGLTAAQICGMCNSCGPVPAGDA